MDFRYLIFILLVFFQFSFLSNQTIVKGINKIIDGICLSVVFDANKDNFNIIVPSHFYIINKETKKANTPGDFVGYLPPKLLYIDKSNHYFLLTEGSRYKILLNEDKEICSFVDENSSGIPFYYVGYFLEEINLEGSLNNYEINEVIIYGVTENEIKFYFTSENIVYDVEINSGEKISENHISCKFLENDVSVCVFQTNSFLRISVFECNRDINKCNQKNYLDEDSYYNGFLYDTLIKNKKFLCFKDYMNNIQCTNVAIIKMDADYQIVLNYTFLTLSPEYNEFSCEIENCNFIEFLSEYLFCCACHDNVICTRFAHNFNIINHFKLSIEGENSDLTILNNINYISIIFNNGYVTDKSIYMKNIYPPYCKNISKYIIEEIEIKFQELFDKKNDSNYYLIFNEFDSTILTIKTKSHNININESTMLNEDESDFKINLKNKNIL